MKYSIWCVLFGHKFAVRFYTGRIGEYTTNFTDNCEKCGLTKKECGII